MEADSSLGPRPEVNNFLVQRPIQVFYLSLSQVLIEVTDSLNIFKCTKLSCLDSNVIMCGDMLLLKIPQDTNTNYFNNRYLMISCSETKRL